MHTHKDLYLATAALTVGLVLSGAAQAQDFDLALPEGTYAGIAAGAQTWPCTSNDCELESSSGYRPQSEVHIGYREPMSDWLTVSGEAALSARMMESHGRNWPDEGIKRSYNNYGLATTATIRVVPEVEIFDGFHAGPLAGVGGGLFFLDDDTAFAPVYEVGLGARYEIGERWSVTARYSYLDTVGGSLAGRDLSYSSHGFLVGLQFAF